MKRIFLVMFAVLLLCATQAQTAFHQTTSNPTGAVINAGVDTLSITLGQSYGTIAIQAVVTKDSGTVAGTAVLYSSVNGTNYVSTGDTLTNSNQAINTAIWVKTSPAKYWRILVTGSGTMAAKATAKVSAK